MAHDTHFLSRLERVDGPALNLALGLYRDAERVKWVLQRLPLGDAEVVALPLLPGEVPPHALVSRRGKFITCLGPGMVPHAAVVTWPQLDLVTGQLQAWRELKAKGQDRARVASRRMVNAGPWLAREDFEDFQVVAALNPGEVMRTLATLADTFPELRVRFRPRSFQRLTPKAKEALSLGWKGAWASSHLSLSLLESWLARQVIDPNLPYEALVAAGMLPSLVGLDGPMVRAGWCISRLGAPAIDVLMNQLLRDLPPDRGAGQIEPGTEEGSFLARIAKVYALLAMAARLPEARATIREALEQLAPSEAVAQCAGKRPDEVAGVLYPQKYTVFTTAVVTALSHLDEADQGFPTSRVALIEVAQGFYTSGRAQGAEPPTLVEGPSPRFVQPPGPPPEKRLSADEVVERVAPDLLFVPAFGLYSDLYVHSELFVHRLHLMPHLATREPPDLFFSQARLEQLAADYVMTTPVEHIRDLLTAQYKLDEKHQPAKAEATPGRNDPCHCGSGAKYKKCCGR